MSMTNHAVGIGTCTHSMTIPSYLHSKMHLYFPDQTDFQSWILNFQVEVYARSEECRARIAVDQEMEATSSLKDLINPKPIAGKDFSDFEELDLMMAAELIWCYDIAYLICEITERRAVTSNGAKNLTSSGRLKNFSAENNRVLFKKRRL